MRATLLSTALAAALLAGALALRQPVTIPAAIGLLAAPYVASLAFEADGLDTRAPLIAGLFFAITELAYWSLELRATLADEPGTYLRRVALLAGLAVGTIAAGTGVLALVEAVSARGVAVDVLGALAAATAIGLLALAASRRVG
ncbi:MAG: hypothetical protein ACXWZB_04095 [Gaiellaceae bacterium]